jgi:predicted ATPase
MAMQTCFPTSGSKPAKAATKAIRRHLFSQFGGMAVERRNGPLTDAITLALNYPASTGQLTARQQTGRHHNLRSPDMHLKNMAIDPSRFPTTEAYPFNLPIVRQTAAIDFPTPVTIFTGENGTGKSTLLKAICRRCNIHIWEGMHRARYKASRYENMLHLSMDVEWDDGPVPGSFFSPELFRNFSQLVDEWATGNPDLLAYFGGQSLVSQSHGQSCMAYFKSIYRVRGLHFLDEPEAALSPQTQMKLLEVLTSMSATGHAQFIVSTHSPILMSCPDASVYDFNHAAITRTSYEETRHYRIYKDFFNNAG